MNFSRLYPLASVQAQFGWEEYSVLAATLAVSALIGVLFAWRGQRNTSEYLLANKQMGIFPTTMSIACSFISAITILGTPAEMYVYGTQYWAIGLSYPAVLAATAHCYLPVFYKLQVRRRQSLSLLKVVVFNLTYFLIFKCFLMVFNHWLSHLKIECQGGKIFFFAMVESKL